MVLYHECQYIGDRYSFPNPNPFIGMEATNLSTKRFYCCCGDCEQYAEDITDMGIEQCDCFDEL